MDDSACFVQKKWRLFFLPSANFLTSLTKTSGRQAVQSKKMLGFPVPSQDVAYQTFPKESGK
jgi:hypothetical protein